MGACGNLPRANKQSSGLFVARCGAPPCTGRGCPASGGAPWVGLALCDPRPCSGSLYPPQAAVACAAIPVRRPKPHGEQGFSRRPDGNLPRANKQSTGLFVARCGAPPCTGRGCPASGGAPWGGAGPLRPAALLRLPVPAAGGGRLRSNSSYGSTKITPSLSWGLIMTRRESPAL